jgi:hypothetical protein
VGLFRQCTYALCDTSTSLTRSDSGVIFCNPPPAITARQPSPSLATAPFLGSEQRPVQLLPWAARINCQKQKLAQDARDVGSAMGRGGASLPFVAATAWASTPHLISATSHRSHRRQPSIQPRKVRGSCPPEAQVYVQPQSSTSMLRSYHSEQTRSHQNSEVNLNWAASVLGREITWEPAVS